MKYQMKRVLCAAAAVCLSFLCLCAKAEKTDVRKLQERLLSLGYEIGEADGIAGEKTKSAILLAQTLLAENGYDVPLTGSPDAKTVELIFREENSELLQTLIRGSRGSRVRAAQKQLIELNLLEDSADGVYGSNTETAVVRLLKTLSRATLK